MIFWSLCAFIWFRNMKKMLLQMTSVSLQPVPSLIGYNFFLKWVQVAKTHLSFATAFFQYAFLNQIKAQKGPENHSLD
jgi:uncharacterized membrane protein YobD (UPF0266 family)